MSFITSEPYLLFLFVSGAFSHAFFHPVSPHYYKHAVVPRLSLETINQDAKEKYLGWTLHQGGMNAPRSKPIMLRT